MLTREAARFIATRLCASLDLAHKAKVKAELDQFDAVSVSALAKQICNGDFDDKLSTEDKLWLLDTLKKWPGRTLEDRLMVVYFVGSFKADL